MTDDEVFGLLFLAAELVVASILSGWPLTWADADLQADAAFAALPLLLLGGSWLGYVTYPEIITIVLSETATVLDVAVRVYLNGPEAHVKPRSARASQIKIASANALLGLAGFGRTSYSRWIAHPTALVGFIGVQFAWAAFDMLLQNKLLAGRRSTTTTGVQPAEVVGTAKKGRKEDDWGRWTFTVEEGFFVHDAAPEGRLPAAVMPRLGLLDDSPTRWADLRGRVAALNTSAPEGTVFKLLFVQRHGEGVHNVAEAFYGSPRWNSGLAQLYSGDGMVWGPDPELTPVGLEQARDVARAWEEEVKHGAEVVLPEVLWVSPLQRAAWTLAMSYEKVLLTSPGASRPVVKENLRERIGVHTCDIRPPAYQIETVFGRARNSTNPLNFALEDGFTLHDELWTPTQRETDESMDRRASLILSELYATQSAAHVALAGHGGIIMALFRVTNHRACATPTGAFIPMVVKGVRAPTS